MIGEEPKRRFWKEKVACRMPLSPVWRRFECHRHVCWFHQWNQRRLIGVEPGGHGIETGEHGAPLNMVAWASISVWKRRWCKPKRADWRILLHLRRTGFPVCRPQHAYLNSTGRADYVSITDDEPLKPSKRCACTKGSSRRWNLPRPGPCVENDARKPG